MQKFNFFMDSSALIAGVISETGAAHLLLQLSEYENISLTVNEFVVAECERSFARKSPHNLPFLQLAIKKSKLRILENPTFEEVRANLYLISDPNDVPVLLSAIQARVDFLVTHNRRHFLDDPQVSEKSGLRIGTPGDAIAWLREQM
jgi:predicted nucleic acid-binding protein